MALLNKEIDSLKEKLDNVSLPNKEIDTRIISPLYINTPPPLYTSQAQADLTAEAKKRSEADARATTLASDLGHFKSSADRSRATLEVSFVMRGEVLRLLLRIHIAIGQDLSQSLYIYTHNPNAVTGISLDRFAHEFTRSRSRSMY